MADFIFILDAPRSLQKPCTQGRLQAIPFPASPSSVPCKDHLELALQKTFVG